jgi:hypothetical protein
VAHKKGCRRNSGKRATHHDQLGHLLFAIQYHHLTIVLYIIYVSLEFFEILDRRWILDSFETLNRSRAFTQRLSNVYVY